MTPQVLPQPDLFCSKESIGGGIHRSPTARMLTRAALLLRAAAFHLVRFGSLPSHSRVRRIRPRVPDSLRLGGGNLGDRSAQHVALQGLPGLTRAHLILVRGSALYEVGGIRVCRCRGETAPPSFTQTVRQNIPGAAAKHSKAFKINTRA